ncbi:MAG: hypothetical protein PWP23_1714 [Candidatus Sumerlaeota bacterium]|nr:hypothetical protein [Candidatus Sumerlaeota bacterium]
MTIWFLSWVGRLHPQASKMIVAVALLSPLLSVGWAQGGAYGVQVASFEEGRQHAASAFVQSAPVAVRSSLQVLLTEGRWRVLLGPFATYPDALLVRDDVRTRELWAPAAFVYRYEAAPDTEFLRLLDQLPPLFIPNGLAASELSVQSIAGDPIYESLRALDRPGNDESYEAALTLSSASVSAEQPLEPVVGTCQRESGELRTWACFTTDACPNFKTCGFGGTQSIRTIAVEPICSGNICTPRAACGVQEYDADFGLVGGTCACF